MITLKHRTASGGMLSGIWEYDAARRCVILVIAAGVEPISVDLHVCTEARPRHGSFSIARRDEFTWVIAPAAYFQEPGRPWLARATAFHSRLPREFLELTYAPAEIARELEQL